MRIELLPPNEDLRLQDLYSYDVLDSEEEKEYNELLEVAAHISNCPIAAISFIDRERQWLKSRRGLEGDQTTREHAFCAHTILGTDVMIVNDASQDERFSNNPAVTGAPMIRFYAGAPIVSQAGFNLGAVCVIDKEPRELTEDQVRLLTIISRQVSRMLELRLKNRVLKERSEECIRLEKQLLAHTIRDHEAQRSSIGTELHENIGQSLAATKFYLELVNDSLGGKEPGIRKSLSTLTDLIREVSRLSKTILPTTLKSFELKDILETLLHEFGRNTGIKTTLTYHGERSVPADISIALYRAVEEQLANVRAHAQASEVEVTVQATDALTASIRDNGVGIDLQTFKKGVGLGQVLARIEEFNGRLDIGGRRGEGCQLSIHIPAPALSMPEPLPL